MRGLLLLVPLAVVGVAAACGGPDANSPGGFKNDVTEVKMEISTATPPPMTGGQPSGTASSLITSEPPPGQTTTASTVDRQSPDTSNGGSIDDAKVDKVVTMRRARLHACYNKATKLDPGLSGNVVFEAIASRDGKVTTARMLRRTGLNEELIGCALTVVKGLAFDPDADQKTYIVPLTFGNAPTPTSSADAGASGGKK